MRSNRRLCLLTLTVSSTLLVTQLQRLLLRITLLPVSIDLMNAQLLITSQGPRASRSPSPAAEFTLAKDDEDTSQSQVPRTQGNQVSAADYDPSLDRREDEHKRVNAPNEVVVVEEEEEEEEEEDDDLDDMFADVDAKPKKTKVKKKKVQVCLHLDLQIALIFDTRNLRPLPL